MLRKDGRFAKTLKAAMKRAHLNGVVVAQRIDVGRTTVYQWLSGKSEPGDANFEKLVALFPELAEFRK